MADDFSSLIPDLLAQSSDSAAPPAPTNPLLAAQMNQESGGQDYDNNGNILTSPKGAKGAMQVLDNTNLDPGYGVTPAQDDSVEERDRVGRDYSAALIKHYGDKATGLAAYNWGPGNVDKWLKNGSNPDDLPAETKTYIKNIMANSGGNQGTQYAQADTGTQTDASPDTSVLPKDPDQMSEPELDAYLGAHGQGTAKDPDQMSEAELDAFLSAHNSALPGMGNAATMSKASAADPNLILGGETADEKDQEKVDKILDDQASGKRGLFGLMGPQTTAATGLEFLGANQAFRHNITDPLKNNIINPIDDAIPDSVKNAVGSGAKLFADTYDPSNLIRGAVATGANKVAQFGEDNPEIGQPIKFLAQAIPAGKLSGEGIAAGTDLAKLGASATQNLPGALGRFAGDESVSKGPLAGLTNKMTPTVAPQTAQLVKDASDLGINIPARVFAPGSTSATLNKVGLMRGDNMKDEVTTALSKTMGHQGTSTLDVDTMSGIQKNIGNKMNDFALKADANGGIPISADDLKGIADDSLADEPKVKKLVSKIQDRIGDDGTLKGTDYQALTKKGGVLDRAMNSSDTELSDTAKELRTHLDDQLQKTVDPKDLSDFQEARRQYRTLKIVQPIVESGGVTGQPDSAAKLFGAVSRNYGSMQNALKYNPQLGKIAQIVNEFPEAIKDTPKTTFAGKAAKIVTGGAAPLAIGAVGGVPAAATTAAILPGAYGAGKILSSNAFKNAILEKSLAKPSFKEGGIVDSKEKTVPKFTHRQWLGYLQSDGKKAGHTLKDKNNSDAQKKAYEITSKAHSDALKKSLGRDATVREIELAHYVTPQGVVRVLKQENGTMPAHKMFSAHIVKDMRKLFFNKNKPYSVDKLRSVLN